MYSLKIDPKPKKIKLNTRAAMLALRCLWTTSTICGRKLRSDSLTRTNGSTVGTLILMEPSMSKAKTSRPKERSLSPHHSNSDYLSLALDRIDILERLVAGLARRAGAHPPYVEKWRRYLIDWPDNPPGASMSSESQYLVDWANRLSKPEQTK